MKIFLVLLGVVALTSATPGYPGYYPAIQRAPFQGIPAIFGQSSWMNQIQPFTRSFGLSSLTGRASIFPSELPVSGRRPFMSTIIPLSNRITPSLSSYVPRSVIGSTFPYTAPSWTIPLSSGISRYTTSTAPWIGPVAAGISRYTPSFTRNISPYSPVSSLTSVGQVSPSSIRILPIGVTASRDVPTSVGPLNSLSSLNTAIGSATRIVPMNSADGLSASQSGITSVTSPGSLNILDSSSPLRTDGAYLQPIGVIDERGTYRSFTSSTSGLQTLSSAGVDALNEIPWSDQRVAGSLNAQGVDVRRLSTSVPIGQSEGGFPWVNPPVSGSHSAPGVDVRLNSGRIPAGILNAGSLNSGGFADGILNSQTDIAVGLNRGGRILDTGLRTAGVPGSYTGGQVTDGGSRNYGGVYSGSLNSMGVADGVLTSQGLAAQSLNSRGIADQSLSSAGLADFGNVNAGGVATGTLNSRRIIDVERPISGRFATRNLNSERVAGDNFMTRRVADISNLNSERFAASREGVFAGGLNSRGLTTGGQINSAGAYDATGMNSLSRTGLREVGVQDRLFTGSTNSGTVGGVQRDVAFIDTGGAPSSGHAGGTIVINPADPGFIRSSQGLAAGSITRQDLTDPVFINRQGTASAGQEAGSITGLDPAGPANPGNLQGADPTYVTDVNSIAPGSGGSGTAAVGGSLSVDQGLVAGQTGQGFVDQGLGAGQIGQGFVDQGFDAGQDRTGGVSVDVRFGGTAPADRSGPNAGIGHGLSLDQSIGAGQIYRNSGPLDIGSFPTAQRPNIINDRLPGQSV